MVTTTSKIPHFRKTETSSQLIVHGKPFLVLGAELQNSALTSAEYMNEVWPKLKAANINTVLGCVTWENIEKIEGQFDFEGVEKLVLGARAHGLRLVILWFGSFKNGVSTYVPSWIKTDPKRFPRAKLRKARGVLKTADVLSIFDEEAKRADASAFGELMRFLRKIDEEYSTVLMVQVENECGLLGDSRDASPAATKKFLEPVPKALVEFLSSDFEKLHADCKPNLDFFKANSTSSGSWEEVFGVGPQTDELFMAYHYSLYLNEVAAAGKKEYPLPLYTNVWQNNYDADNTFPAFVGGGKEPGGYPSGGGTTNVLDIWQRFAPNLDMITPDVYLNDYTTSCAKYRHKNQPLFIAEQRRDEHGARRIWVAYGSHQAIGVSPFGIDTLEPKTNPFTKHYGLLSSVSQIVLEAQRRPNSSIGFYFDEITKNASDRFQSIIKHFGDWELRIERAFVFGKSGPGAGMIIHLGGAKFLLIGWGFQVRGRSLSSAAEFTGILRFEEKLVADRETGELRTLRTLNGDETRGGLVAVMPNEDPDYGDFPICVTIPARTMIGEVEFYAIGESSRL
ncbi:glycoside hydrolase [Microthyrium microscopicum]|uniref:Glycoside hydrolase n=1 Tax=Microthyrium microscopicum TaxID=703497 RepID=A0A6A6UBN2_9PEZI|nr:glycoside hydrolase [Microthyrium microscopicum]